MNTETDAPHFLIVGSPRSGTTLVQRLASELPGVRVPPETHFFPLFYYRYLRHCEFPLREREIRCVTEEYLRLPVSRGLELSLSRLIEDLGGEASCAWDLFSCIVRQLAGDAALIGEKTPNHLRWWMPIHRASPALKFVAVVRDPRAVVASAKKAPFGLDSAPLLAASWRQDYYELERARAVLGSDRLLILRYESVVAEPNTAREQIGAFLGVNGQHVPIEDQKSVELFPSWETNWKAMALGPVDTSRATAWRDSLTAREQRQVDAVVGGTMRDAGYEPLNDAKPTRLVGNIGLGEFVALGRTLRARRIQRRRIQRTEVADARP